MVRAFRWFRLLGRRRAVQVMVAMIEAELFRVMPEALKLIGMALDVLRCFAQGMAVARKTVETDVILAAEFLSVMTRLDAHTYAVCAMVEWAGRAVLAPDDEAAARCCVFGLSNAERRDPSFRVLEQFYQNRSEDRGGGSQSHERRLYAIPGGRTSRGRAVAMRHA